MTTLDQKIALLQLARQMESDANLTVVPVPVPTITAPSVTAATLPTPSAQALNPYVLATEIASEDAQAGVVVNGVNEGQVQKTADYGAAMMTATTAYNTAASAAAMAYNAAMSTASAALNTAMGSAADTYNQAVKQVRSQGTIDLETLIGRELTAAT